MAGRGFSCGTVADGFRKTNTCGYGSLLSHAFAGTTGDDCLVAFHTTVVVRLDRTIQYAAASRLFSGVYGILGRPVPSAPRLRRGMRSLWPAEALAKAASRAMTSESLARSHSSDTPLHSRGVNSPEPCMNLSPFEREGAGNAGRSMRPQPRMQNKTSIRA